MRDPVGTQFALLALLVILCFPRTVALKPCEVGGSESWYSSL